MIKYISIFFYIILLVILIFFLNTIRKDLLSLKNHTKQIETQFKQYKDNTALSYSKFASKKDLEKAIKNLSKEIKKELKKEKVVYVTTGQTENSYSNTGVTENLHYKDKKVEIDIKKQDDSYLWNYKINQNFHFNIIGSRTKDAYRVRVKITDSDTGETLKIKDLYTKYNFNTKPDISFFIGGTTNPAFITGIKYKNYSIFYQYNLSSGENSFGVLKYFNLNRGF